MIPARDCFNPVMLTAAGARLRTACFEGDPAAAARGLCVLLNGQTEFIEKYFEVIDELRRRGLGVASMDWRGQGGSGRLVPGAPMKVHIRDFAEYDSDLSLFMDQVVAPLAKGGRPIALAHSMGGHILLNYLSHHPDRFAAAVCCAPMLQISTRGQPRWLVRALTDTLVAAGRGTDFVWGMGGRDPLTLGFAQQIVTSDPKRFQRATDFLVQHPDLRVGGPTWGWVAAAYRAMARFEAQGFAERITTPVLILGAGHDRIVITGAERRFAAGMPNALYREIEGAEHEILMERDVFRTQFWQAFDAFIARQL